MYSNYGIRLSDKQKEKILKAVRNGNEVTIQLKKVNLRGTDELPLTNTQINRINKGVGFNLHLSKSQMKVISSKIRKVEEKTGGILPLLTLLPLIFGGLGAVGGVAGGVASAVSAAKSNAEQARHNRVVEAELAKSGSGVSRKLKNAGTVNCSMMGNGIFLTPANGSGLFLGPYRP